MTEQSGSSSGKGGYRKRRLGEYQCHCCREKKPFCWSCPCGFQICDACFQENKWGISNGPTWICPDCGRIRMM
ncbi:MAG: hypothetical protein EHM86_01475 [Desulfobulbaceae bacterium]|nr:MAG: hypothetical protein EHM86_01475 [Desulfobulbaceae bacterium]